MLKKKYTNLRVDSLDGLSKIWHTPYEQDNVREYYYDLDHNVGNYLPIRVRYVHEEHCFEQYYRKREHAEVFSIELVLEGSMFFSQEGRDYRVMPGEVFLVHLDRQNEFTTGPEKHCHRLACILSGKSLNNLLHTTGLYECDVIKLKSDSNVESLMRSCFDEFKHVRPKYRLRASELAYQILLELSHCHNLSETPELIERAVEIMEHHLSKRLTLNQLAKLLGSSRSSLTRLFYRHFQVTPINYFIHLKMEAAKSMLVSTALQIQEVARRVGYDSPLYFSSEFKKRIGQSPRDFRKKLSGNPE